MNCLFYGDSITPGTQPVLVFPIEANIVNLTSTYNGTSVIVGTAEGSDVDGAINLTIAATDIEMGTDTDTGTSSTAPVTGQLSNLNVAISKDGAAFVAATGHFAEVSHGYYLYVPSTTETNNPPTPNSSNTGTVFVRIYPTNPSAISGSYIEETCVWFRLRAPGTPQTTISPSSQSVFSEMMQPVVNDLKKYINQMFGQLLPSVLTNKPSFKKD